MNQRLVFTIWLLFVFVSPAVCQAGWESVGGVVNVDGNEDAEYPTLVFSGDTPYICWHESNTSNKRIYAKHFNGTDWVSDGNELNVDLNDVSGYPSMAIRNGSPVVTWSERSSPDQVYAKYLNGTVWEHVSSVEPSLNVDVNTDARFPSIICDANTPYVTWFEHVVPEDQVFVKKYNGSDWEQIGGGLQSGGSDNARESEVDVINGTPYVVWQERGKVFVRFWNGTSWEPLGGRVDNGAVKGKECYPEIAGIGNTPYVAWDEEVDGGDICIYVKWFNGTDWESLGGALNMTNGDACNPALICDNGTPYVSWHEDDGDDYVYAKYWNGSDWVLLGNYINDNTDREAQYASIAILNGTLYVAWGERDGTWRIFVKKYIPPTPTATPSISSTPSITQTLTISATCTQSATYTPTPTISATCTQSATYTPSPSVSATSTYSATYTITPSITFTSTQSATYTATPSCTRTATGTMTSTVTFTATHTVTSTHSPTSTITPTYTISITSTITPTITPTPSITLTATISPTGTWSPTSTITATITLTVTATSTKTITNTSTPVAEFDVRAGEMKTYPSPATGADVWFYYYLEEAADVRIDIYNIVGEKAEVVKERHFGQGYYRAHWNIRDVAPGIYLYKTKLVTANGDQDLGVRKLVIVK
jgi:hypothetical protein